ncbi:histidine kinase [Limnohabitans sp. Rim8]|uniref:CBS domain-containing protein n=1 Tax=Limnohabitans sp. Rim8 TaxID=1100718 RepID=UPI000D33A900|nr:CBS domain-containing protein [Limnohabitans sp. Rim8]PUE61343.1 histidine kinase [Limnohabitans sp. Rim8]
MGERLTVGEICTREVTFADKDTNLVTAAQLMRRDHVGALVVVDHLNGERKVSGLLTDRDIVTCVIAQGIDPGPLFVEDIMSAPVITVQEDDSLIDLMRTMRTNGIRRVPVVNEKQDLVGLVTLDDVLRLLGQEFGLLVAAIDKSTQREVKRRP